MDEKKFLRKLKKLNKSQLEQMNRFVEQGVVNNTTNKRMKELENQLEDLDRQIIAEKSKSVSTLSKEAIKEFFVDAIKLQPKVLIDYVIKEIKVYENKLEIIFNSTIKINPDENQGSFLFVFNSKMPKYIQNKEKPEMLDFEIKCFV